MLQWIRKIHTNRKLQKKQSFLNMKDDILEKLTVNHKTLRKQIKYLELFNERQDIYRNESDSKKEYN